MGSLCRGACTHGLVPSTRAGRGGRPEATDGGDALKRSIHMVLLVVRKRTARALVLLAMAVLAAVAPAAATASPIVVLDTLGAATPDTTFSVFGSGGEGVLGGGLVGPQFTLTKRT